MGIYLFNSNFPSSSLLPLLFPAIHVSSSPFTDIFLIQLAFKFTTKMSSWWGFFFSFFEGGEGGWLISCYFCCCCCCCFSPPFSFNLWLWPFASFFFPLYLNQATKWEAKKQLQKIQSMQVRWIKISLSTALHWCAPRWKASSGVLRKLLCKKLKGSCELGVFSAWIIELCKELLSPSIGIFFLFWKKVSCF